MVATDIGIESTMFFARTPVGNAFLKRRSLVKQKAELARGMPPKCFLPVPESSRILITQS
eukprot:5847638-Lingulodinium_polyedra.AAC.1